MSGASLPVVVVGGGPAGLAVTYELIERGHSVTVVECSDYDDIRIGEHLPPSSISLFAGVNSKLGLHLEDYFECRGVESHWGADTPSYQDYLFHPLQRGVNLSRPAFDREFAQACERAGAVILRSSRVTGVVRHDAHWSVGIDSKGQIATVQASFLVDATGRTAQISRKLGAAVEAVDNQVAIAAYGKRLQNRRGSRSLVEAYEGGWWYCADVSDEQSVCILVTDIDLVPKGRRSELSSWWAAQLLMTKHILHRFQLGDSSRKLYARSARSQRTSPVCGSGWIALGDAALVYDPLSSRGIAKALSHGQLGAAIIADCMAGNDAASEAYAARILEEYAEHRNMRRGYYVLEGRWPDSVYWTRRRQ